MIANPPNTASARLVLPSAAVRGVRTHATRVLLAASLLLGAPAVATAADGGIAVTAPTATTKAKAASTTKTKAKGAQAEDTSGDRPKSVNRTQLRRAQTLLRVAVTGTHDAKTRTTVKRFQRLRGLAETGIVDLATYLQIKNAFALLETGGAAVSIADDDATGGATTATPVQPPLVLPANLAPITPQEKAILDAIGQCESKGDPTALSASGQYRGKYQFDKSTWKTVGGTGDPAAATEEEQDQRAAILLRQKGTSPWPVCAGSLPDAA